MLLLIPGSLLAQERRAVEPIISSDYHDLLRKPANMRPDSIRRSSVQLFRSTVSGYPLYRMTLADLKVRNGMITPVLQPRYMLRLAGSVGTSLEVKMANRTPSLQQAYAQGRSGSGTLQWHGAETGEMFSFGPALRTLEFDGKSYTFDPHGKLVPAGTGTGQPAAAYYNAVLRTGISWKNNLNLDGSIYRDNREWVTLGLGLENENGTTAMRYNDQHATRLVMNAGIRLKDFHIETGYQYRNTNLGTDNRIGLLNRIWQQSLLTPASFDNTYTVKPYGSQSDNPWTLLKDNGNHYTARQRAFSVSVKYGSGALNAAVEYAGTFNRQEAGEAYPAGTYGFPPAGMAVDRNARLDQHVINAYGTYRIGEKNTRAEVTVRHILSAGNNVFSYTSPEMRYSTQRTVNELLLEVPLFFRIASWVDAKAEVSDRTYFSNTIRQQQYWLPSAAFSLLLNPRYNNFRLVISSRLSQSGHETPLEKSLAHLQLANFNSYDVSGYFPTAEVKVNSLVKLVRTSNWNTGIELHANRISATASIYVKHVKDDQFPFYAGSEWVMGNIADHRTTGYEVTMNWYKRYWSKEKLQYSGNIGLNGYRNKVTKVAAGMDYTTIAGFRDVHTALVKGEPFGVVIGSTWRRDASGRKVIGADGFPLAGPEGIIGNPNPDFILKHSSRLEWRNWQLDASLEWKKGGEVWNGTQAMLDYYGRSRRSGDERNITGYVFDGVTEDGRPNTRPVAWYDPSRPLAENRWVRYGPGGVAEDYVQRADYLRLHSLVLSYRWQFYQRLIRELVISGNVHNLLLWTPYEGGDPARLLFDYSNGTGLDFFNLPSVKKFGCNILIKF